MPRNKNVPSLNEADDLSRPAIEAEIARLKTYLLYAPAGGSARHQATRSLASWERVLERRFDVPAPKRPARRH
jgi:hypothetical protein